jgi:S-adenosylmethionine:tRNA ribosyltransferase-isomerase
MKTRDFFFNIDKNQIAQYPPEKRGTCRLMVVRREDQSVSITDFSAVSRLLPPGTLLVINDSRVRKARVYGTAIETGGKVEFLFLKEIRPGTWEVLPSKLKKQRPGKKFIFGDTIVARIIGGEGKSRLLEFETPVSEDFFEICGHVPLPPYIHRDDVAADSDRYQTVYSGETGSSAAPTAGLHFTPGILHALEEKGIDIVRVTLHVGIGTFVPIRTDDIEDHIMHEEEYSISHQAGARIEKALEKKQRIVAVGTTSVRTLESAYDQGKIKTGKQKTSLYIYPGYRFKVISGLITNFHTPGSSLLVMVSAFAGIELIRSAYQKALGEDFRFFSYGDAMLIE